MAGLGSTVFVGFALQESAEAIPLERVIVSQSEVYRAVTSIDTVQEDDNDS